MCSTSIKLFIYRVYIYLTNGSSLRVHLAFGFIVVNRYVKVCVWNLNIMRVNAVYVTHHSFAHFDLGCRQTINQTDIHVEVQHEDAYY